MSERALKLIKEVKKSRSRRLDLGNCYIWDIPIQAYELYWVEELILCEHWEEYSFDSKRWIFYRSINMNLPYEGRSWIIFGPSRRIQEFKFLKKICIDGKSGMGEKHMLESLSCLENMDSILHIYVNSSNIRSIDFINSLKNLTTLYFEGYCVKDLSPILNTPNLKAFSIRGFEGNNFTYLSKLFSLQALKLDYAEKLIDINFLYSLNNIVSLDLSVTKIRNISALSELKHLEDLTLDSTKIISLDSLRKNNNLKHLSLRNTNIKDIKILECFPNLETLSIEGTQVKDFTPLKELKNLKSLCISRTDLKDIQMLRNLEKLECLDISYTSVEDISPLEGLCHLKDVQLYETKVKNISALSNSKKLHTLDISNSKVTDLSVIKELRELSNLNFERESQFISPPDFIVKSGLNAIRQYYEELELKENTINNQTKLIFVGNSQAGKTSIVKYLTKTEFDPNIYSTHGIDVEFWDNEKINFNENQSLKVHICDFGGQAYFHATHRLFLSENAVYVLVWENETNKHGYRRESLITQNHSDEKNEDLELEYFPASYWLDIIRYYGGNSPILIVQNKVDTESTKKTHEEGLLELNDYFHLSIKNAFNYYNGEMQFKRYELKFQDFKERLLEVLRQNAAQLKLSSYFVQVRNAIRNLANSEEYIHIQQFREIALKFDSSPDEKSLLAYLKDYTNTILHFPNTPFLANRIYLRPENVCKKIYSILNISVKERNGEFDFSHVQSCLEGNWDEAKQFTAIMKEFDLIFEKQNDIGKPVFVAPQYLPQKDKISNVEKMIINTLEIAFFIRFKAFVPRDLILRFISMNGAKSFEEFYWRNGIVYQNPSSKKLIKVEFDPLSFIYSVEVQDRQRQIKDLQNIILQFVALNNNSVQGIEISSNSSHFFDLGIVQNYYRKNFDPHGLDLPLAHPNHNELSWLFRKQAVKVNTVDRSSLNVFISYSRNDIAFMESFRKFLNPLERSDFIKTWVEADLMAGETWADQIRIKLNTVDVIVFLISSDSLHNDFILDVELNIALQRFIKGEVVILPVILRQCAWEDTAFSKFKVFPEKEKTVENYSSFDDAWKIVYDSLKGLLKEK
jgi:internalin A